MRHTTFFAQSGPNAPAPFKNRLIANAIQLSTRDHSENMLSAIDLPEANVAIELSGTFGSRQEEAQRLGRILRPKAGGGGAFFYAVVSSDTVDQAYADHRQLFLTEQGYRYQIEDFVPNA